MTAFRISGAQWARPGLIRGLAELATLGADADGEAAEAAAWLSDQLEALPCNRRRRRDTAIVALRLELCALQSDNSAAAAISASLGRFAARLRRENAARRPSSPLATSETLIDRLRREVIEAGNGKAPGQRSIRAILATDRHLAKQKQLRLPTNCRKMEQ